MDIFGRQTATETLARGGIHDECRLLDQRVDVGVWLLRMQLAEQSREASYASLHFRLAAAHVSKSMPLER